MNKLLYTIMFLTTSISAFAQIGIKAGINISKYSYSQQSFDIDRHNILAYNFGINYKQPIGKTISFWPELVYTVKGADIYHSYPIGSTGPMKYTNKFSYLQLNLPAVAVFEISDSIDYELGAGIFGAYLTNAKVKVEEFDGSSTTIKYGKDDLKAMDFGFVFTTGIRLNKTLGLNINYDLGLQNIETDSEAPKIKTSNFSLGISWVFSKD